MDKSLVVGVFDDERLLLNAVKETKKQKIPIYDTYTPFAVHGLDEAMGIRRSRLPIVCFLACLVGCLFAFWLQVWTSAIDWPIIVGGKPFNSFPAFIPVAFEVTVLFGGLTTVAVFFFRSGLYWGKRPELIVDGVTDDQFVLVVEMSDARISRDEIHAVLEKCGAYRIGMSEVSA